MVTDFSPIHVGLQVDDWYLLPTSDPIVKRQRSVTHWRKADPVNWLLRGQVRDSFLICPYSFDPTLVSMLGDGQHVDSRLWLFMTEPMMYLKDAGLNVHTLDRTACLDIIRAILRSMGVDTQSRTARFLYKELAAHPRAIRTNE